MTDKERIEAAAEEFVKSPFVYHASEPAHLAGRRRWDGFKAGVTWRDENPSPEVEALVKALEQIKYAAHDIDDDHIWGIAHEALQTFREAKG